MGSELKDKTAKGLFWGGLSNGAQQILSALFGIVLARILNPGDYGTVGMLAIFSALASTIQESGFTNALINRREIRRDDYNAVFWFNVILSVCLYAILFFCAPLIAKFFHTPVLVPLSRYIFLSFVVSSMGISANAYLTKKMMIKEKGLSTLSSMIVANIAGIILALNGYGFWGMATQTLLYSVLSTGCLIFFARFRPSFKVDFTPVREMFGFSVKLMITNACEVVTSNVFSLILGRFYTEKEVGYYSQGNKWDTMGYSMITGMTSTIAQPLFVEASDDKDRELRVFRKMVRFCCFTAFPAMFGLALVAPEFITVLLKEKWADSATILRILCFQGAFQPLISQFLYLIISHGKSSLRLWITVSLCAVQIAIALLLHPYGITAMITAYTAVNILWVFVWYRFARRITGYSLRQFALDVLPFLLIAGGTMVLTHFITLSITNNLILLISRIIIAAAIYILANKLLKVSIYNECVNYVKERYHIHTL